MSSSVEPPESALAAQPSLTGSPTRPPTWRRSSRPRRRSRERDPDDRAPLGGGSHGVSFMCCWVCCCWVGVEIGQCGERLVASDPGDQVGDRGVAPGGEQATTRDPGRKRRSIKRTRSSIRKTMAMYITAIRSTPRRAGTCRSPASGRCGTARRCRSPRRGGVLDHPDEVVAPREGHRDADGLGQRDRAERRTRPHAQRGAASRWPGGTAVRPVRKTSAMNALWNRREREHARLERW